MTQQAVDALYSRAQAVANEIDIKSPTLKSWQGASLHASLAEMERVLQGERREQ